MDLEEMGYNLWTVLVCIVFLSMVMILSEYNNLFTLYLSLYS